MRLYQLKGGPLIKCFNDKIAYFANIAQIYFGIIQMAHI